MHITLPLRFYRAVPSRTPEGLITERWNLDLAKTAFVSLHAWNVGCPGGPPVPEAYWVDMGSPQNHEVGWCIITEEIVPALAAARKSGMTVVHVQSETIGKKYPHLMPPMPGERLAAGGQRPDAKIPTLNERHRGPISDHYSRRASRVHGEGYMDWEGWKDLDFAEPLRPLPTEAVFISTEQWDDWLREGHRHSDLSRVLHQPVHSGRSGRDAPDGSARVSVHYPARGDAGRRVPGNS